MRKNFKQNLKTFTTLIKPLSFFNKYNQSFSRGTLERCYLYNQNESFKCAEAVWQNVSHRSQTLSALEHRTKNHLYCNSAIHLSRLLPNSSVWYRTFTRIRPTLLGKSNYGIEQRNTYVVWNFSNYFSRMDWPNNDDSWFAKNHIEKG